jgi:hypothetical protein
VALEHAEKNATLEDHARRSRANALQTDRLLIGWTE